MALKVELDNAVLRQKRAMEQLSRRELELKGKDEELNLVLDEKQKLKEELEVVKVIAGQLQDLNQVLERQKMPKIRITLILTRLYCPFVMNLTR